MSVRQFRTFLKICDSGSFAAAARDLNLTQSAVSMQISTLEQSLGVDLFDRKRRPLQLTPRGRLVAQKAKPFVAQYDSIIEEITEARAYVGVYKLGVIPTVVSHLMPSALVDLREVKPELKVNVISEFSGRLLSMAGSGEIDGAVLHRPYDISDGLYWRDIARQAVMVIAPPGSTEETAERVFANHQYIRFQRRAWVAPMIEKRLKLLDIEPDTYAEIESIESIYKMVSLGLGASVIPVGTAESTVSASVRIVEFGMPRLHRMIGMISRLDTPKKQARRAVHEAFQRTSRHPQFSAAIFTGE